MKSCLMGLLLTVSLVVVAGEWRNLEDSSWIAGPKLTSAKLKGRIVLVERWGLNCPPCRASLPHVQALYKKYASKGVVVLGAHCQGLDKEKIVALLKSNGAEFPVYQFAGYDEAPPTRGIPAPYIVDQNGKVVWSGVGFNAAKVEEALTAAVKAVPNLERDVMLADIEESLESRPGIAYNKLQAFLKKYPKEKSSVQKVQASLKDPKVRNLAKLESELEKLQATTPNGPAAKKKLSDTAKALARKAKALGADYLESEFLELQGQEAAK